MMRRTFAAFTGLTGNGIIGIRREDKNVWERRVPLTPTQVAELLDRGNVKKVVVQPSTIRCYRDQEYAEAGAEINEDLSEASAVCAVKEVPGHLLIPERSYLFFSHTIKAQPYNMPLLDTILDKKVRLIDYERIAGPHGRLVKFGPYAGFAGMIDTLHGLGKALLMKGFATPFLSVSLSKEYRSLQTARDDLLILGNQIRKFGYPRDIGPLTIAVTGAGAVSLAAQEMLHHLPCKYVLPEDLPKLWKRKDFDNKHIYVVVVTARDMVSPKDSSKPFNKREYYNHPERYRPVFHTDIAPYCHVLVNGIYWEEKFPRLLTNDQALTLKKQGRFPLLVLGDITCDIGGSVEMFVKATTIQNPYYVYRVDKGDTLPEQDYTGDGVLIMGVDHLPAEFPREASTDFGAGLIPLIEKVALSDGKAPLSEQHKQLGDAVFAGQVTNGGKLTPHFNYIATVRAENEANAGTPLVDGKAKKILVIGSGMTAGPAVEQLLTNKANHITIADTNADSMELLKKHYGNENVTLLNTNAGKVEKDLEKAIQGSDVVISMLPATMHPIIAEYTIKHKVPMVTASYTGPGMQAMKEKAEKAGTFVINEVGLDPGIDIMTTAKMLNGIRGDGGVIQSYVSICGALPGPEFSNCPLGYKFSWFPRGVLAAANRPTKFRVGSKWFEVPGKYLFHLIQPTTHFSGLDLHWIPNGDATPYSGLYDLPDSQATNILRGTFRYRSYAPAIAAMQALGLVDDTVQVASLKTSAPRGNKTTWNSVVNGLLDAKGAPRNANLVERATDYATEVAKKTWAEVQELEAYKELKAGNLLGAPVESRTIKHIEEEIKNAIGELEQLGVFGYDAPAKTADGFVIDSLCNVMINSDMAYRPHERDFVLMIHRIKAYFPATNNTRIYTATLTQRGESVVRSATSKTVGAPVGIAAQLVLDGALSQQKGLVLPTLPALYEPLLLKLEDLGVTMHETVEEE